MNKQVYIDVCWNEPYQMNNTISVDVPFELTFLEQEIDIAMNITKKLVWSGKSVNINYRFE